MTDQLVRTHWQRDATNTPDLHPIGYATWGALIAFGIAITAIESAQHTGFVWRLLLAANIGLWVKMILFVLLLIRQSQLGFREWTTETPVIPETGRAMRVMAVDLESDKTVYVAKYSLSDRQMKNLAGALYRGGWKMTRDEVRRAEINQWNINQWDDIVAEFKRVGLIDNDKRVTRVGRELFEPYLSPAPAQFQATFNPPPVRRQSDGAAREGR